jgi:hypothetical protein
LVRFAEMAHRKDPMRMFCKSGTTDGATEERV